MIELPSAIPDVRVMLALEPEELGAKMLFLLRGRKGVFNYSAILDEPWSDHFSGRPKYPPNSKTEAQAAIAEGWAWLLAQGLIIPEPGMGGVSGNVRLSRRARKFESEAEFANYAAARHLPKEALHRSISGPVWMSFMRGEFETAAFQAMKAVEVAVRDAARLGPGDYGVSLMRKAFDVRDGVLTDKAAERAERQALGDLFAGAIGSYKNRILIAMYHSPTQARPPRSSCSRTIFSELSMPAVQAISRWVRARPVSARTAAGRLGWSSKSAPGDGTERPGVAQSPRKVPGQFA